MPRRVTNPARAKRDRKKWNRQNPHGRRHGPQKKDITYMNAIQDVIDSGGCDDWRTGAEISWEANKQISKHWTALSVYVLCNYMRRFIKEGKVEKYKPISGKPNVYRKI